MLRLFTALYIHYPHPTNWTLDAHLLPHFSYHETEPAIYIVRPKFAATPTSCRLPLPTRMPLTLDETYHLTMYILTDGQEGHVPVATVDPPTFPLHPDSCPSGSYGRLGANHISANIHQGFLPSASSTAPLNLQPNSCTRPYPADQQYSFNIGTRQPYEEPLYSAPEVSRPRSPTPQRCIHNECLRHSHDHHTYASPNGPANSFHPPTANLDPWKA
ncbi:hypothetical protein C8Q72DRAFT_293405 [Fomitopsis betulina]|nr:hypothetical protein C8Q72DRAFT_293405 [Fomitopsis betulina]